MLFYVTSGLKNLFLSYFLKFLLISKKNQIFYSAFNLCLRNVVITLTTTKVNDIIPAKNKQTLGIFVSYKGSVEVSLHNIFSKFYQDLYYIFLIDNIHQSFNNDIQQSKRLLVKKIKLVFRLG